MLSKETKTEDYKNGIKTIGTLLRYIMIGCLAHSLTYINKPSVVSTKLKLYNICILPIMLYRSECWALSKADARKIDALDQWCLRRILDIRWYHRISNRKVRHMTEQPPLTAIIQKRRLMLFGHLARMDETADARRILTGVYQSNWTLE